MRKMRKNLTLAAMMMMLLLLLAVGLAGCPPPLTVQFTDGRPDLAVNESRTIVSCEDVAFKARNGWELINLVYDPSLANESKCCGHEEWCSYSRCQNDANWIWLLSIIPLAMETWNIIDDFNANADAECSLDPIPVDGDVERVVAFYGNGDQEIKITIQNPCFTGGEGDHFALTTSVEGQGSVWPNSGTYAAGTIVPVTALPASGWRFDHWEINGDTGIANPIAQVTLDGDVALVAVFAQNQPPVTTGKLIVDLTTTSGIVSFKADAPDGYAPATFGGIGSQSQIQSVGLQLYYEAAVNGLWTDRQTFAFGGTWPVTGALTKVSGRTLRFEVVANDSGGWGDPDKLIIRLNGVLVPRVTDESGYTAYQVTLPKLGK